MVSAVSSVTQCLHDPPWDLGYNSIIPALSFSDPKLMFAQELVQAGHTKRFSITEAGGFGWEVTEEQDSAIVRRILYTDWHRVERALSAMTVRVSELQRAGWRLLQGH